MPKEVDVLIIGGGITGRLLQMELISRNLSTLVVDELNGKHCSEVAAGLANPLVGKFFTIGWRANDFFNDLSGYYKGLETRLNASFFKPMLMKRVMSSAGEQNIWLSKAHQTKYNGFVTYNPENIDGLNTNFGILDVHRAGELTTVSFLKACAQELDTLEEYFDFDQWDNQAHTYRDITYKQIVFCEGYQVKDNPVFKDIVQIVPTKGELLEIETELPYKKELYLGSVFIQHLRDNRWRVGSTYDQNNSTLEPTEMMREDLEVKLKKTLNLPFEIVSQVCGVRPASIDRSPILGEHPSLKGVFIFNGMGSKAVSLAPVLASELVDLMTNNTPLQEPVDIKRFC